MNVGEKAPEFTLPDQDGNERKLKDFLGKWVVLYFYPKDDTPGCTIEANEFTLLKPEFGKLDAVVIGVSADTTKSHYDFVEKHKLDVILLTDKDHAVMKEYNAYGEKSLFGKLVMGIKRSTFLIDPLGNIAKEWQGVHADGHANDVLETLRELRG